MRRIHSLLLLLFVLSSLAWIGGSSLAQEGDASTDQATSVHGHTLFLVRHAEKAKDDPRDPNLSPAGKERAKELGRVLQAAGVTHLFSSSYKRTHQTLAPLATASGLGIVSYDVRDIPGLVQMLRDLPDGAVAVVAGHSNTTPGLYEALSGGTAAELEDSPYGKVLADDAYDRLFSVTLSSREGEVLCTGRSELRFGKPSGVH